MTLRFTMEEFRKIPRNDKILFGVLIAIILANSMIPRVREGATNTTKVTEVSVPKFAFTNMASMGVINDDVLSISGSFTTTTDIPPSSSSETEQEITFTFPADYFTVVHKIDYHNPPMMELTHATLTKPITIFIGATKLENMSLYRHVIPESFKDYKPSASGTDTISFKAKAVVGSGLKGISLPAGTYSYKIRMDNNVPLFKLKATPLAITSNGWSVKTTADPAAGFAKMPPILAYDSSSAQADSESTTSMTARQKAIMANIANLQRIEKQIFDRLSRENDPTTRTEMVAQINQIAKARGDLYNNMNDFAGAMQSATADTRNALRQQLVAAQVVESQLNTAKSTLDGLREDKSNKLRLVEINNYYGRKYEYQTDIMKLIVITCAPILVISILMKKGLIPELIATGLIVVIIAAGIIAVVRKLMDLNRRNNMNFDQYDSDFNPYAVSVTKTETTNLADLSKLSLLSTCVGASCCNDTTTVWDEKSTTCIPGSRPADEKNVSGNDPYNMDALASDFMKNGFGAR